MKKVLAILLSLAMVLALAACAGKTDPAPAEPSEPDETKQGEDAQGNSDTAAEKQQWGFIFEQLTNPNYVTMSGVASTYCESLGIDLQIVDGQENSDTIVNAAENMATMGYQVILLSPMNVEITATAALAAKAINPEIIVVNSANQVDECDYSLLQDDYTSGVVCGQYAGAFANENQLGQALLLGYPRDQALIDRENGFLEGLKETAPDVEVINQDMSNYNLSEFTGACENLMTAYPECRVVYAISDIVMSYFYESLQASGQDTSQWALYSVDGTLDGVSWIYENKGYRGTADTGTLEIPTALVDAALALQAGQTAEEIQVELPVTMIDSSNVDGYAEKIGYEK